MEKVAIMPTPPVKEVNPVCDATDDLFFYGFWLDIMFAGEPKHAFVWVTSNREVVLPEMDELSRIGIRPRYLPDRFTPRWKPAFINNFLDGVPTNPEINEVFGMCEEFFRYFLDIPDERVYKVLALWTIATYLMPIWYALGYLTIFGLRESGKSKVLEVLDLLAFNATKVQSITSPSLFRYIEMYSPTLLMDETDFTEPTKHTDLLHLLYVGYKRGIPAIRSEKTTKEKIKTRKFNVFCPKALVAPHGMEPMLLTRCIIIRMLRTSNSEISRRWPTDLDPKINSWAENIRNYLYRFALERWRDVKKEYESLTMPENVDSRNFEVWAPLFALAKIFNCYDEIVEYARETSIEKRTEELLETEEFKLLRVLLHLAKQISHLAKQHNEALLDAWKSAGEIASEAELLIGKEQWIKPQRIGRILSNTFAFTSAKGLKKLINGTAKYKIDPDYLRALALRHGIDPENPLNI